MVCELIDEDSRWWNSTLIREIFSEEEAGRIYGIPICPNKTSDILVWVGNKNGDFTVRSAYHMAKESSIVDQGSSSNSTHKAQLWKTTWQISRPRAVKMFLWKACSNILPTNENIFKRRITDDPRCPICNQETETVEHIFWSCPAARDVWLEHNRRIQTCSSDEDAFINIFEKLIGLLEEEDL